MFKTSTFAYWCCQATGWGLAWGIYEMNGYINHAPNHIAPYTCISGFLATHLLRTYMHRFAPRALPLPKEGLYLLLAIIATTGVATALKCLGLYYSDDHHLTLCGVFIFIPTDYLVLIIPWTLIYWGYRLVIRTRVQTLERRRLEWRLKQMQAQAGGSEVTMEDLMEEVNRIVELIDENPARARSEITAFSRLLREGHLA